MIFILFVMYNTHTHTRTFTREKTKVSNRKNHTKLNDIYKTCSAQQALQTVHRMEHHETLDVHVVSDGPAVHSQRLHNAIRHLRGLLETLPAEKSSDSDVSEEADADNGTVEAPLLQSSSTISGDDELPADRAPPITTEENDGKEVLPTGENVDGHVPPAGGTTTLIDETIEEFPSTKQQELPQQMPLGPLLSYQKELLQKYEGNFPPSSLLRRVYRADRSAVELSGSTIHHQLYAATTDPEQLKRVAVLRNRMWLDLPDDAEELQRLLTGSDPLSGSSVQLRGAKRKWYEGRLLYSPAVLILSQVTPQQLDALKRKHQLLAKMFAQKQHTHSDKQLQQVRPPAKQLDELSLDPPLLIPYHSQPALADGIYFDSEMRPVSSAHLLTPQHVAQLLLLWWAPAIAEECALLPDDEEDDSTNNNAAAERSMTDPDDPFSAREANQFQTNSLHLPSFFAPPITTAANVASVGPFGALNGPATLFPASIGEQPCVSKSFVASSCDVAFALHVFPRQPSEEVAHPRALAFIYRSWMSKKSFRRRSSLALEGKVVPAQLTVTDGDKWADDAPRFTVSWVDQCLVLGPGGTASFKSTHRVSDLPCILSVASKRERCQNVGD